VEDLLDRVTSGRHGRAPGSVVILSGDVHHAYLSRARFPGAANGRSPTYQAVCSPIRNPLDHNERRAMRFAVSPWGERLGRLLTRAARVEPHVLRWEQVGGGPWFDNQIATLELDGRHARMRLEKALGEASAPPQLECVMEQQLA
jgi:hypothetical protein